MTKQKKEAIWLGVLAALAVGIWYFEYFNRSASGASASMPILSKDYMPMSVENSRLHLDRLEASRRTECKSCGWRDITSAIAPLSPADIKKAEDAKRNQPPPPPPLASPVLLPVKFFGYGTVPMGTARRAFFTDGEDVFIAAEGDMLQGRFRILHIGNTSVEFEEISSGKHGSAPLEEQAPVPSA
jgi:hypothetical protein